MMILVSHSVKPVKTNLRKPKNTNKSSSQEVNKDGAKGSNLTPSTITSVNQPTMTESNNQNNNDNNNNNEQQLQQQQPLSNQAEDDDIGITFSKTSKNKSKKTKEYTAEETAAYRERKRLKALEKKAKKKTETVPVMATETVSPGIQRETLVPIPREVAEECGLVGKPATRDETIVSSEPTICKEECSGLEYKHALAVDINDYKVYLHPVAEKPTHSYSFYKISYAENLHTHQVNKGKYRPIASISDTIAKHCNIDLEYVKSLNKSNNPHYDLRYLKLKQLYSLLKNFTSIHHDGLYPTQVLFDPYPSTTTMSNGLHLSFCIPERSLWKQYTVGDIGRLNKLSELINGLETAGNTILYLNSEDIAKLERGSPLYITREYPIVRYRRDVQLTNGRYTKNGAEVHDENLYLADNVVHQLVYIKVQILVSGVYLGDCMYYDQLNPHQDNFRFKCDSLPIVYQNWKYFEEGPIYVGDKQLGFVYLEGANAGKLNYGPQKAFFNVVGGELSSPYIGSNDLPYVTANVYKGWENNRSDTFYATNAEGKPNAMYIAGVLYPRPTCKTELCKVCNFNLERQCLCKDYEFNQQFKDHTPKTTSSSPAEPNPPTITVTEEKKPEEKPSEKPLDLTEKDVKDKVAVYDANSGAYYVDKQRVYRTWDMPVDFNGVSYLEDADYTKICLVQSISGNVIFASLQTDRSKVKTSFEPVRMTVSNSLINTFKTHIVNQTILFNSKNAKKVLLKEDMDQILDAAWKAMQNTGSWKDLQTAQKSALCLYALSLIVKDKQSVRKISKMPIADLAMNKPTTPSCFEEFLYAASCGLCCAKEVVSHDNANTLIFNDKEKKQIERMKAEKERSDKEKADKEEKRQEKIKESKHSAIEFLKEDTKMNATPYIAKLNRGLSPWVVSVDDTVMQATAERATADNCDIPVEKDTPKEMPDESHQTGEGVGLTQVPIVKSRPGGLFKKLWSSLSCHKKPIIESDYRTPLLVNNIPLTAIQPRKIKKEPIQLQKEKPEVIDLLHEKQEQEDLVDSQLYTRALVREAPEPRVPIGEDQ